MLSHQTAAELWGLVDGASPVIHVTVPHGSNPERCGPIPGVVIHQSRSLQRARHPVLTPPRTRVEETVLDLIDCARTFDEATAGFAGPSGAGGPRPRAFGRRLDARSRIQWRFDVELALGYASGGALSVLELRYARGVERAHGLPVATRQARIRQETGNRYLDNLYSDTALALRSTVLPRTRRMSNGGTSVATAGTRCTKGSTRSGSGCLT